MEFAIALIRLTFLGIDNIIFISIVTNKFLKREHHRLDLNRKLKDEE